MTVMDLEETEARNDRAGEDQQQFNRPNELVHSCLGSHGWPVKDQCGMAACRQRRMHRSRGHRTLSTCCNELQCVN
jgi:hypothetical protein